MKYNHLTREQRYAIFLGLQRKETIKSIAEEIGVSKSTVSREIKRNKTARGNYVWTKAQEKADSRKHRNPGNRAIDETVKWRVKNLIKDEQWLPKQISGYLKKEDVLISHETIYKMVREDATGELALNCRHKMKYKRKATRAHVTKATNIKNRVSIHVQQRPTASDRATGRWT